LEAALQRLKDAPVGELVDFIRQHEIGAWAGTCLSRVAGYGAEEAAGSVIGDVVLPPFSTRKFQASLERWGLLHHFHSVHKQDRRLVLLGGSGIHLFASLAIGTQPVQANASSH